MATLKELMGDKTRGDGRKFKSNFDAQVNQIFTAECMQYAKDALQKKTRNKVRRV